jgi:stearoyl-CoA desaturase (delta-9 desaturase)
MPTRSRRRGEAAAWPRRCSSPQLAKLVAMREELRQLWTRTNVSAEQLVADLQAWCRKAESSGIVALAEFSLKLRAARA